MSVNADDKKKKRKLILSGAALVISALLLAISYVSDYLIYTNAKFYNGIISTRDFDSKGN